MSDEFFNLIYNKSLDLLSRREHSKKEIKEKLRLRFNDREIIDNVLSKLLENNLVNDKRFAEAYVVSRKRKGFGPKKIIFELISKGVEELMASEVIGSEGEWTETARLAYKKKFKNNGNYKNEDKLKQKSFLQKRGFSYQQIESVFSNDML